MKAAAVIVAGGSGKRFASALPKQFLSLGGKPVFMWSVETFSALKAFRQIIVVVPSDRLKTLSAKYKNITFAAGGKERFDSVKAGLALIDKETDLVAVHDAARPLIDKNDILAVLKKAKETGAAIAAEKTKDTVKTVKNGKVTGTLDRSLLWNVQTPQIFKKTLLDKAYSKKIPAKTTDDSQLIEKMNVKVYVVETSLPNFKITGARDFVYAKEELKKRKK